VNLHAASGSGDDTEESDLPSWKLPLPRMIEDGTVGPGFELRVDVLLPDLGARLHRGVGPREELPLRVDGQSYPLPIIKPSASSRVRVILTTSTGTAAHDPTDLAGTWSVGWK